jgi:hypothetical protein
MHKIQNAALCKHREGQHEEKRRKEIYELEADV